jgi:ABC-2 type transport system permease protein
MPIFFLSGALFPLKGLPNIMENITKLDPLTYGVDGLRGTLTNIWTFNMATDFIILGIFMVIPLAIGSFLFSKIQV